MNSTVFSFTVVRHELIPDSNNVKVTALVTDDDSNDDHIVFTLNKDIAAGYDVGRQIVLSIEAGDVH